METAMLLERAARAGIAHEALIDAISRAERHFGSAEPTVQDLDTYYQTTLKAARPHLWPRRPTQAAERSTLEEVAAKHGMSADQWQRLSPEKRSTRERTWLATHGPAPGPKPKTGNYLATGEDLKALAGKSLSERLTFGHTQTQQQKG